MSHGRHADPARLSRSTRAKLLVLLPLTMALLVAATGFFMMSMTRRIDVLHGTVGAAADAAIGQVGVQLALISLIVATLGFGIALGVTAPLREVAGKLEAIASGDLRAALDIKSTSELDSLSGAFNDAIGAINRYVFQSMTGAVVTLNADGIVTGSSPATEVILGYNEDELVGRRFSEVFTPVRGDRAALASVEEAISRREAVAVDEVAIAAKDGRPIRIGISVSYLRRGERPAGDRRGAIDATEEAIGVMIAFKDLTEIRRLRDRLQQADQLVSLGTLTAGVAHELRNPLASMQGLAELLKRDLGEQDSRGRYLDTMLDAIGRLNRLVEDLLLFSSPSSALQEDVDVHALVQETVMFVRLGLGDRPVVLTLSEDDSARGLIVSGSGERLGQALSNVLLNAVQATPDGGAVTVRTAGAGSLAVVTIHNTGSYIPPDRMRQLFVPFFTTKPTGTGLGLAISRQIMTAHGGRVEVESDRVAGTTFQIELPVARRLPADQGQPAADGGPRIHLPLPTAHTSG